MIRFQCDCEHPNHTICRLPAKYAITACDGLATVSATFRKLDRAIVRGVNHSCEGHLAATVDRLS